MVNTLFLHQGIGGFRAVIDQQALVKWNFQEELQWTPENPRLFDINFYIYNGDEIIDQVQSYFGMRKVSIVDGKFMLNNRPYYQKLVWTRVIGKSPF